MRLRAGLSSTRRSKALRKVCRSNLDSRPESVFEVFELREVSPSILIKDFHEKSTGRLMIANPAASSIQETFKTFKFFSFIEIAKVKPLSSGWSPFFGNRRRNWRVRKSLASLRLKLI